MGGLTTTLWISMGFLLISVALVLVRFIRGPSLPDRVIALDVFSGNLLGILAVYSVVADLQSYLDVAIVLALIAFVGTIAFVYYLLKRKAGG